MANIMSIDNVANYRETWLKWYNSLQPEWRSVVNPLEGWPLSRAVPEGEKWATLCQGGPHGLLVIILTLFWWHRAAKTPKELEDVTVAIVDATWMFRQLFLSPTLHPARVARLSRPSPSERSTRDARKNAVASPLGSRPRRDGSSSPAKSPLAARTKTKARKPAARSSAPDQASPSRPKRGRKATDVETSRPTKRTRTRK